MWFFLSLGALIATLLFILPLALSSSNTESTKCSPVESGFSSLSEGVSFFNNHFFILLVIFVLFDLEVVLFICLTGGFIWSEFLWGMVSFMLLTLVLEWWFLKLNWTQ